MLGYAVVWSACGKVIEPGDLVNASLIGKFGAFVDQQLDAMAPIDGLQFLKIYFTPVFPVPEHGEFVSGGDFCQQRVKNGETFRAIRYISRKQQKVWLESIDLFDDGFFGFPESMQVKVGKLDDSKNFATRAEV